MNRPLCFVLMPFGRKPDASGSLIDFDDVYRTLIAPAIDRAGLEPLRADEEEAGGIIHKPMFERLILCEYAVADLTTANANVFYELGIRHAVRPWSTVLVFAQGGRLPFDLAPLRGLPYRLLPDGKPADVEETGLALEQRLREAQQHAQDSPIFQLVKGYPKVEAIAADVFRNRVQDALHVKARLAEARSTGVEAVREVQREIGNLKNAEPGVVIDLFLSYRAVEAWSEMIALVNDMSRELSETVMVQEQFALALNRACYKDNRPDYSERAERTLLDLIERRGPSSETYGNLGRVYKDRWEAAQTRGELALARGLLDKAIDAYVRGFETDWRDAYPGVNAVTLMEVREPIDDRRERLFPVVSYAVERRIAAGKPDYWDYATRLELAVLAQDEQLAQQALGDALAAAGEPWMPGSTIRNLRLIRVARERRQAAVPWAQEVEDALLRRQEALRARADAERQP